jgi:hypothetical protein
VARKSCRQERRVPHEPTERCGRRRECVRRIRIRAASKTSSDQAILAPGHADARRGGGHGAASESVAHRPSPTGTGFVVAYASVKPADTGTGDERRVPDEPALRTGRCLSLAQRRACLARTWR